MPGRWIACLLRYHLHAETNEKTLEWAAAIQREQARVARLVDERQRLDGLASRTRLSNSWSRSSAGRGSASDPDASDQPDAGAPSAAGTRGGAPPPVPSERLMRQQGLLKYGWVDASLGADSAIEGVMSASVEGLANATSSFSSFAIGGSVSSFSSSSGGVGGARGGKWRRQWLVLRDDGLILFYQRAKDSQPARILFAHEFEATAEATEGRASVIKLTPTAFADAASRPLFLDPLTLAERDTWLTQLRDAAQRSAEHALALDARQAAEAEKGQVAPSLAIDTQCSAAAAAAGAREQVLGVEVIVHRADDTQPLGLSIRSRGGRESVQEVVSDSPAAAAGLLAGDVLLAIDGVAVLNTAHVAKLLTGNGRTTVTLLVGRPRAAAEFEGGAVKSAIDRSAAGTALFEQVARHVADGIAESSAALKLTRQRIKAERVVVSTYASLEPATQSPAQSPALEAIFGRGAHFGAAHQVRFPSLSASGVPLERLLSAPECA